MQFIRHNKLFLFLTHEIVFKKFSRFLFFFRYYKCKYSKKYFCSASIKKIQNGDIISIQRHNHEQDLQNLQLKQFKDTLISQSSHQVKPITVIYDEEARKYIIIYKNNKY